jgi:peptide/nickel transport system substrate-binding protein
MALKLRFPAVQSGAVIKAEIPHGRPSGIEGFVFNTRKSLFADWRVREALILAFNFEFINQTLNGGLLPRIPSYFGNSALGMEPGTPATGRELALLDPFKAELPPARSRAMRCRFPTAARATARTSAPPPGCWKRRAGPWATTAS